MKPDFIASLAELGPVAAGLAKELAEGTPEVSVRANAAKSAIYDVRFELPLAEPVPYAPRAWYLSSRPDFTLDPALHQGLYYVQDASSMFVAWAVHGLFDGPVTALDACAAPGGKSTALMDALPEGSLLIANEIVPKRAAILRENIIKWGSPNTIVTRTDTDHLGKLRNTFDLILADVPCSGEGMMRKDAEAVEQWSPGLVAECARRQQEITSNLWEALRPGGVMVYSTCTFNRHEDEEQVARLIDLYGAEPLSVDIQSFDGIVGAVNADFPAYRFMPHLHRGEGLFMALLRKPVDSSRHTADAVPAPRGKERHGKDADLLAPLKRWIVSTERYSFDVTDGRVNATPIAMRPLLKRLADSGIDVIHHGIPMALVKGRDLIPSHALAMSTQVAPEAFHTAELQLQDALAYLRRDNITLADAPKGFVLLTHHGAPLGFVKNLGPRANNLYPQDWRIRKG